MKTEDLYAAANAVNDEIYDRLQTCDWYRDLMRKKADLLQQWLLQWTAERKAENAPRKRRR